MEANPISYIPNLGTTVSWVALIVGIILYIIGYYGGIRFNLGKPIVAMAIGTIISVLARPLVNKLHTFVAANISVTLAGVLIPLLWTVFIIGVAISMYETFTVTAREAHPYD